MIQQSYDRAMQLGDKVYVVTEASHSDALRAQLPELPDSAFLIEPGRRGTAHCIVFALDYIARNHDKTEPVAFIHADHYVRDVKGFARSFKVAAKVSSERNEICLIGIEPTFAATGFGYIERDGTISEDGASVYRVKSFKEKPDFETATQYVESGNYLWNCGYFVGSVDTFLGEMQRNAPDLLASYDSLAVINNVGGTEYNNVYSALDNQVIDIALIEKADKLSVVSASFDWVDVGNFKDLHDVVLKDQDENYIKGSNIHTIEVDNVYVRNEESKAVAVIGLDNVIVVNTPDGLLIARKDLSAKCGDIAKKLQN